MSMLPFADPVGEYAAIVLPRQTTPPLTLGEPVIYTDAAGNLILQTPDGTKNGYVLVTNATYSVGATDRKLAVNRAGTVTVLLPDTFPEGETLTIWDAGENAGMPGQAITVTPPSNQQINSLGIGTPLVLSTANARVSLIRSVARWNGV